MFRFFCYFLSNLARGKTCIFPGLCCRNLNFVEKRHFKAANSRFLSCFFPFRSVSPYFLQTSSSASWFSSRQSKCRPVFFHPFDFLALSSVTRYRAGAGISNLNRHLTYQARKERERENATHKLRSPLKCDHGPSIDVLFILVALGVPQEKKEPPDLYVWGTPINLLLLGACMMIGFTTGR